ncbi:cupin domain-containing protein [Saccharopolyspora sp. K220]|uniref:cupin domain-containing protein n=1 Tax=Saccharopolyspora soli TaxID=2926618 RepID=UPI001F563834|nr:cupin domain-containing protein [Saccharopolyspora soli]MCI2421020.1 cupin domain-containing protein [Saccharopolyspora soli]
MSLPKDVRTTKGRQNVRHYPPDIYRGNGGEISAWMRPNSTPPDLTMGGGEKCEFIAISSDTNGRFGLYRWTFGENETGPEAHFHRSISEQFYVLSGEVKLYDGSTWVTGRPGDYFYVPEGGIHAFKGGDFASMLLTFAPGGPREAYFEAMAAGGMSEDDDRQEFMIRHDNFLLV